MSNEYKKEDIVAIKDIINDTNTTWVEKLDKVIQYKKDHCGLIGMHFSAFPTGNKDLGTNEEITHDICMLILSSIEGTKDITHECL